MKNYTWTLLVLASFILSACASKPKDTKTVTPSNEPYAKTVSAEEVRQALDMEINGLGFSEKSFNSCSLPKELQTSSSCETKYFSIVHFQVLCRNTTGTTEETVTSSHLRPLSGNLEWVVGALRGKTTTNKDGFGTALILSKTSMSKRRFILKLHQKALGLTAEDVSKIVVPDNWCQ